MSFQRWKLNFTPNVWKANMVYIHLYTFTHTNIFFYSIKKLILAILFYFTWRIHSAGDIYIIHSKIFIKIEVIFATKKKGFKFPWTSSVVDQVWKRPDLDLDATSEKKMNLRKKRSRLTYKSSNVQWFCVKILSKKSDPTRRKYPDLYPQHYLSALDPDSGDSTILGAELLYESVCLCVCMYVCM